MEKKRNQLLILPYYRTRRDPSVLLCPANEGLTERKDRVSASLSFLSVLLRLSQPRPSLSVPQSRDNVNSICLPADSSMSASGSAAPEPTQPYLAQHRRGNQQHEAVPLREWCSMLFTAASSSSVSISVCGCCLCKHSHRKLRRCLVLWPVSNSKGRSHRMDIRAGPSLPSGGHVVTWSVWRIV